MAPVNSTRIQQAIDYCLNKGGQISESAKRFGVPEKQLNYLVSEALNPFTGPSTNKELWDNFENTRVVKAKLVVGNQSYYLITTGFDSSEPKMTAYDTNGNAINVNTLKKTYGIADFQVSGNGEITLVAKQNSATNMHLELENDEDGYFDTLGEYKQEGMGALQENSFEVTQKTLYSEDLAKNPVKTPYENTLQQDAQIREQTIDLLINDTQNALAMLDDYRDSFGYVSWDAIAQGLEGIGNVTIDKITGSNLFVTVGENKEALEKQLKQLEKLKKQADNPETFAKQFKETFGVDYNPENFHNLTQTAAKYKEMNAYNSLSNYFGNGIEKLKSSDVSDFEAAGMLAPLFKGGVTEAQEYIKNIRQISKNDTEFKNNLISVLEESKKSIDSNLKGVDLQSLENAYRQRYKNAMGENTEEETIDGFINIAKRNAMFTEVGVSIASGSLASSYGKLTSVIAGASPSAIESVADGATGGDGTLEEGLEKFKNNMAYGLFGAYVSGPLGTSVSKVLSSNGNVFKNIVSNHKFTMVAGTTAETTADVLFDNIMSDMSFRESLEQNGIMNFSMMFLGGAAHKTNNTVNPDLPNVDMSQIKIEKMSDGTFNLKADNKLFFKAKDEDELAMAVLSLGQNNEARKAHSSQQSTSEGTITHNTPKPGADTTTARTNTEHTTNTANSTPAVKPQNTAGDISASKTKEQTVPESEIIKTSSATIDKTQGITSTTLGETAKTTPKSSIGNVFVYNPTNNPNVKLKEYTYVLKSGRKLKLIGPEGLDQKNLQILINTDLNRRILQQQLPHFKEYSESTQIRLARLMTNCPPSLKPRLQNMLRTAIDETTCLKIINDKQALTQRLNDIKELEEFFKPNEFYYLEGLLEIKTSDPAKYQKIANSGIFELIKEGKVDASALNQLNKNSDLSADVYNDLALVKSGKSIVPEFPEGTDLKTAFEQTSTGDAVEVGNKMYINDGNTLVEWNMTKEKYLELFPPVQRFTTTQSLTISNCHLIQTLGLAMHNPNARAQFLQSFELNGNDVVVTVKSLEDYNGSKTFTNGEIQLASQNKHLTGCKGLQMYEQTYSEKALREKELDPVADPDIASIDELMTRSAWGLPAQTMGDVFGQGSMCDILPIAKEIQDVNGKTEIKLASSYSTTVLSEIPYKDNSGIDTVDLNQQKTEGTKMYVFNKFFKDFPDKTLSLSNLSTETTETLLQNTANNPDFMISFGTILPHGTAAESKLLPEYNLISSHAYSIVGYDTINKTVKIANPHSYAAVTEIPLDTLQKYIGNLDFIKL